MARRRSRGFTLLELMIVVAIVGILAAVAIPRFEAVQYRAIKSEVDIILGNTKEMQLAWYGAHDCFATVRATPEGPNNPGRTKEPWISSITPGADPCGDTLGFADTDLDSPAGVYFAYQCEARDSPEDFTCTAVGDLDEDGTEAEYVYCTDYSNSGAGCLATPLGNVSFFPFVIDRTTSERW